MDGDYSTGLKHAGQCHRLPRVWTLAAARGLEEGEMRPMRTRRAGEARFASMVGILLSSIALCYGDASGGQQGADESLAAVRTRVKRGDATVVPVLRRWLVEASDTGAVGDGNERLFLALRGVGEYRVTDCAAVAAFFYKQAPLLSVLRQFAADAVASIGARESLLDLKSIVWDQQQKLAVRCKAAAALVELDDDLGRKFLLLQYDLYRLEYRTARGQNMGPVRDTLERMYDRKLVAALEARVDGETDTMRNNITTLLVTMAINAEPVEALKTMAADPSWSHANRRYAAIVALGCKGDLALIPFLESLRPWEGLDANPEHLQQKILREEAEKAALAIRLRNWQQDGAAAPAAARDGLKRAAH